MREEALAFVKRTIANQKKSVERVNYAPNGVGSEALMTRMADLAAREAHTLLIWETILTMMDESEVPISFPVYGVSPIMKSIESVMIGNDAKSLELLNGGLQIPQDVIESAHYIADWFDANDIKDWKLGGVQKRK